MSYEVRVVSGPAEGWRYVTFIEPEEEIGVAPIPLERDKHGEWMRVLLGQAPPWDGQQRYRRREPPPPRGEPVPFERLSALGDIIVEYEHVPPDADAADG